MATRPRPKAPGAPTARFTTLRMSDKLIDQLGAQGAIAQAVTRLLRPSMERLAMTVDDLMQQIKETERLIALYRNASEVVVGTQDEVYSRRGLLNRTSFTAAEIGAQIVSILERRLAAMRAELSAEFQGESP